MSREHLNHSIANAPSTTPCAYKKFSTIFFFATGEPYFSDEYCSCGCRYSVGLQLEL